MGIFLNFRVVLNVVIICGNEGEVLKLKFYFKKSLGGLIIMIMILIYINLNCDGMFFLKYNIVLKKFWCNK